MFRWWLLLLVFALGCGPDKSGGMNRDKDKPRSATPPPAADPLAQRPDGASAPAARW